MSTHSFFHSPTHTGTHPNSKFLYFSCNFLSKWRELSIGADIPVDKAISQFYGSFRPSYNTPNAKYIVSFHVWLGHQGVNARVHYDAVHNFYIQFHGTKRFVLFPPSAALSLYLFPKWHHNARQSQIDLFRIQHAHIHAHTGGIDKYIKQFPLFANEHQGPLRALVVDVQPGEVLYLPPYWFHWVSALSTTVSLSLWQNCQESLVYKMALNVPLSTRMSEYLERRNAHTHTDAQRISIGSESESESESDDNINNNESTNDDNNVQIALRGETVLGAMILSFLDNVCDTQSEVHRQYSSFFSVRNRKCTAHMLLSLLLESRYGGFGSNGDDGNNNENNSDNDDNIEHDDNHDDNALSSLSCLELEKLTLIAFKDAHIHGHTHTSRTSTLLLLYKEINSHTAHVAEVLEQLPSPIRDMYVFDYVDDVTYKYVHGGDVYGYLKQLSECALLASWH